MQTVTIKPTMEDILNQKECVFSKVFFNKTIKRAQINELKGIVELLNLQGEEESVYKNQILTLEKDIDNSNHFLRASVQEFLENLEEEDIKTLFRNVKTSAPNRLSSFTVTESANGSQPIFNRLLQHIMIDLITIDETLVHDFTKNIDDLIALNKELLPEEYIDSKDKDDFTIWVDKYVEKEHISDVTERYLEMRETPQSKAAISMLVSSVVERLEGIKNKELKQAKANELLDVVSRTMIIY